MGDISEQNFCIGPYVEVRINTDGSMNYCHAAIRRDIPASDNISIVDVDKYFNVSQSVIDARRSIESGQNLDGCENCYRTEKLGSTSFRLRRNIQAAIFPGKDFQQSFNEAWPRISAVKYPRFYHISLGNLCNLSCMMCQPIYSSLLTQNFKRIGLVGLDQPTLLDWTQDQPVWTKFLDHLLDNPYIECLHFMGGEPLYHKKFHEILDKLMQNNHTDFHITVVTNGTIFDDKILEKLKSFKSVAMEISLESLDLSNNYIRYPSDYQQIRQNILKYAQQRTPKFDVVLRSVPQFLSLINYDALMDFAKSLNLVIDSNILYRPSFFQSNILPDEIKQTVIDKLNRFTKMDDVAPSNINLRDGTDISQRLSNHAKMVISLVREPCPESIIEDLRYQLVDYCAKIDRSRNFDVGTMIPELKNFFTKYGYYQI